MFSTTLAAPPFCVFLSHFLALGSITLPLILILLFFSLRPAAFSALFFPPAPSLVTPVKLQRGLTRRRRPVGRFEAGAHIFQSQGGGVRSTTGVTSLVPFFFSFKAPCCAANKIGFVCWLGTFQRSAPLCAAAAILAKMAAGYSCNVGRRSIRSICQLNEVAS